MPNCFAAIRQPALAGILATAFATAAHAPGCPPLPQGDLPLKIGVLTDLSGPCVASGGPGSVLAAEMAVTDFEGTLQGRKIEIVAGATLNKPGVAPNVTRKRFGTKGVSAVVDQPVTPVALAVQVLAKQANKTVLITAAATSDFAQKACHPNNAHWAGDTQHALDALAVGSQSLVAVLVDMTDSKPAWDNFGDPSLAT